MPFLFKIIAILIGIFIWKSVVGSFRKASKAMHDDSYEDGEDSASAAQSDLETQWRETAKNIPLSTFDPGNAPNAIKASITGSYSGHAFTIKRFGHNYVRYFVGFQKAPGFHVCVVRDLESIAARIMDGHPIYPSKMFFSSQEPDFYCSAESEDAFDRFLNTPSNRSAVLNLIRLYPAAMFNDEGVSAASSCSDGVKSAGMERGVFFDAVSRSGIGADEGASSALAMAAMRLMTETSGVEARSRTETPSLLNIPAGKRRTRLSTAERLDGVFRKRSNASSDSAEQ